MLPKAHELPDDFLLPLRREQETRARTPSAPLPAGNRKEQLKRQREKIQEYLETIERVTRERDDAREQCAVLGDLADRMLSNAETAQNRMLELEAEVAELRAENAALLENAMIQAERIELGETRLRLILAD